MSTKLKTVRITYFEDPKSKEWMNRNLRPQEQSGFIRESVRENIKKRKEPKQNG